MTGHILDSLVTQVGPHVWNKLTDADKKIFTDVMQEAAARGTDQIKKREGELVSEFKKKGINMIDVNKDDFRARIVKAVDMASMGYDKKDWDRIQAIK
jgi:TRAP-type C4-dicarboxylate transport system substrate-binding protein